MFEHCHLEFHLRYFWGPGYASVIEVNSKKIDKLNKEIALLYYGYF